MTTQPTRKFPADIRRGLLVFFHLLLASLFLIVPSRAMSLEEEEEIENPFLRRIPIERQVDEIRTNRTPHFAYIRSFADEDIPPEIWVPEDLLTQMQVPAKLNEGKTAFALRIDKPGERLGVPVLKQLAPLAIDLDFRARSEDGIQHFNLNGLERATGLSHIISPNDILIVGRTPLMSRYHLPSPPKTELVPLPSPFNLVWDHVLSENTDVSSGDAIPALHVYSPTWFALKSEAGELSNKADTSYVLAAHHKGHHVWALVSNSFKQDLTHTFLTSAKAQDTFIAQILTYAALYGFDGINVDFENVRNDDAAALTAFVKKLTEAARTMGLIMSIDVMVPTKWSACYQRKALSEIVDYVAVMTYDEHWSTSPKAGSTASLPWVRAGLERTLKEVPAEKLLLGIPLYTREWEETPGKNGKISLKSRALAMTSVDARLAENEVEKRWLGDTGQHYFQYQFDGKTYRIWVEDEHSIVLRMELVKSNALAGAAFWRKGFEKEGIWEHVLTTME